MFISLNIFSERKMNALNTQYFQNEGAERHFSALSDLMKQKEKQKK
jgi:hypothetical protein